MWTDDVRKRQSCKGGDEMLIFQAEALKLRPRVKRLDLELYIRPRVLHAGGSALDFWKPETSRLR